MIFSENRYPLFGIMPVSMIFSENRYHHPDQVGAGFLGIML